MHSHGLLSCFCAPPRPVLPDARNLYECDLDVQYPCVQAEETYLRRKYLQRHKTVSFAEDLHWKRPYATQRKAVTSILKRKDALAAGR